MSTRSIDLLLSLRGRIPRRSGLDHMVVPSAGRAVVRDVSALDSVTVAAVVAPTTVAQVQDSVRRSRGPISVGGGRFSMGGQTASEGSLHLDMRGLDRVLDICPAERTIRVQSGARWCDVQRALDAHDLSVKIMQTYANFTVGGSLSVNAHGRYVGQGPLILSVRAISVVLHDGTLVEATRTENDELFHGAIGGYGGLGVIVDAELDVVPNGRVRRVHEKLPVSAYREHFEQRVRTNRGAVFHNADLFPPDFERVRSITWVETDERVTTPLRLMPPRPRSRLMRFVQWAIVETPLGCWRREHLIEPLMLMGEAVHWRNYEAGYDVGEIEPACRETSTYVLNEYFVPVARLGEFVPRMASILRRFAVDVLNVSIRHANADCGSVLAWAREEVFSLVVYFQHGCDEASRGEVAVWNREMIDALLEVGGSYYLPYQVHATPRQFEQAYPRAREWFALKRRLDPDYRFRNALWNAYYPNASGGDASGGAASENDAARPRTGSEFRAVFSDVRARDRFFLYLQNVYRPVPEREFHALIRAACAACAEEGPGQDEAIYRSVQEGLPRIRPWLAPVTYAVRSLRKEKREMTRQTLDLLGERREVDGYVEIGTTGRYVGDLRRHVRFRGAIHLVGDAEPTYSPVDMLERGRIPRLGSFIPLDDYAPLPEHRIPDASVDLVTCYTGLHHAPPDVLDAFISSIRRVLRPGGLFVLREHDCTTPELTTFVSLVHTVFNAGSEVPWSIDRAEIRRFTSVAEWVERLAALGFTDSGRRLIRERDSSANTLLLFVDDAAEEREEERS